MADEHGAASAFSESMSHAFRTRFALLVGGFLAVAALTFWGVQRSWAPIAQLERRLTTNQFEGFRLAEEFQSRLRKLNNSMLRFAVSRDESIWKVFEEAAADLDRWLDNNDPGSARRSSSEREWNVFKEINVRYDDYMAAARRVRVHPKGDALPVGSFEELSQFDEQANQLLQLAIQLAESHREAEQHFLKETNESLAVIRFSISGGVILLLILSGGLGLILYRDLVAPLRLRLVESEILIMRQEKLATLGTLAAGVAHEIRNPLTSIKARLYTLNKHIPGNDPAIADADVIRAEISRLDRIVQDVLRFGRPSEPKLEAASVDAALREVHSLMSASLENAAVRLELETDEGVKAMMDLGLIKQVLVNLVRNGVEAIEGGGTVTLRSRAERAQLHGKVCDAAVLEVADTGNGITPEVEKRLFDPFFTTKEAGTGLGLSIAARIVEKHEGVIQYQTQLGRGTTFRIILPATQRTDPQGRP